MEIYLCILTFSDSIQFSTNNLFFGAEAHFHVKQKIGTEMDEKIEKLRVRGREKRTLLKI
jgi:hypothetical protein